jgi:LysR family nitrogen assimilation transcriptional regulator
MDIRQLRYFVAIAEEGSLSRAAGKVHVAQPALSQHVRNMERDLKVDLLFRTSRGVQLTEAGERLVKRARQLIGDFDALKDVVRGDSAEPVGEVRFGVPGTVSQVLSARLIKETAKRYPRIKLRIAEAMSGFILDWLREGKVDIAVLYRGIDGRGLRLEQVLTEELLLLGPADAALGDARPFRDPVAFRKAIALPLVVPSPGHGLRDLLDEVAAVECGAAINAETEIDSYAPIKTLVELGLGFSILPAMAIKGECAEGRLRAWPITEPEIRRKVFVATQSDRPIAAATAAIESLCRDILRQLVIEGSWEAKLATV